MPMLPLIIGAGMGLLQADEQQKESAAQRQVAAATIAYSPYTKANINDAISTIHPAKYASDVMGEAAAGARYAQGGYGPQGGNTQINAAAPEQLSGMQNNYQQLRKNMVNPYGSPAQADPNFYNGSMNPMAGDFWKKNPYGSS